MKRAELKKPRKVYQKFDKEGNQQSETETVNDVYDRIKKNKT